MTIAGGLRQWAAAGLALVVLTACAASVAGVAQPVPAPSRSGVAPVPVSDNSTSEQAGTDPRTTEPGMTEPGTTEQETTEQETTEQETTGPGTSTAPTTRSTARTTPRSSTAATPTTATAEDATARLSGSGAIVVRRGTPTITVDVFEEPYCPPCAEFSKQYRKQLDAAVADGTIALRLRVVTFLDPKSPSGDYSTRVLSALLAVAGIDGDRPGVFLAFQNALFDPANQPEEGAAEDLTDAQIAVLAEKAGVSDSAMAAFGTDAVVNIAVQASAGNQAALEKLGANSVPTVVVNQKVVDHRKSDWLTRALGG